MWEMLKKLVCLILGHRTYLCLTCQKNFAALFASTDAGEVKSWTCSEKDRCQNVCARCDVRIYP